MRSKNQGTLDEILKFVNKYFHEKEMSFPQGGTYSWGVEEVDEGRWYIFLNISGIYAGVERKAV